MKQLCLATVVAALLFPSTSALGATCPTPAPTGAITWTTPWCDEFNGTLNSAISTANWTFDTGGGGFGNNELETYCDPSWNVAPCSTSTPNAFIDGNGHLAIRVLSPAANTWTSARLKSQGLQTFNSGRIEASIQIPSHAGLWPAFWMLGSQSGVSWPTVGESDILENWPTTSTISGPGATGNCSTIHTQITAGSGKGHCFNLPRGGRIDDPGGHIYGQIWSANMIQYYIDDPTQPFFVVTASDLPAGDSWPFSSPANPFFIIMNIAVGGTLGAPTDSTTGSQSPMLVDYVRQYLPSQVSPPQLTPNGSITVKAGATTGNTTTVDMLGALGSGRVTFTCSTNAPKANCAVTSTDTVNNHTVDFSSAGAATVTVAAITTYFASAGIAGWNWLTVFGGLVLALLVSRSARRRSAIGVACLIVTIALLPSCGGSYGGSGGGGGGSNGTPVGNYMITVNAFTISSTDATTPSATTSVGLTVN